MTLKFIKNLQNITSMPKNMRKTLKTAIKKKRNTSQLVASLKAKAAEAATTAAAAAAVVAELKEAEEKEEEADAELDDVILTFASAKIH
jgi:seryl-tRNA synthetase